MSWPRGQRVQVAGGLIRALRLLDALRTLRCLITLAIKNWRLISVGMSPSGRAGLCRAQLGNAARLSRNQRGSRKPHPLPTATAPGGLRLPCPPRTPCKVSGSFSQTHQDFPLLWLLLHSRQLVAVAWWGGRRLIKRCNLQVTITVLFGMGIRPRAFPQNSCSSLILLWSLEVTARINPIHICAKYGCQAASKLQIQNT